MLHSAGIVSSVTRVEIPVTEENLWFLERHLNVFDCLDLFPADAVSTDSRSGVPLTFTSDDGFRFVSDIDHRKMQLRNRSHHRGWMKWTASHDLHPGDRVIIEKSGERTYSLRLEPKHPASD